MRSCRLIRKQESDFQRQLPAEIYQIMKTLFARPELAGWSVDTASDQASPIRVVLMQLYDHLPVCAGPQLCSRIEAYAREDNEHIVALEFVSLETMCMDSANDSSMIHNWLWKKRETLLSSSTCVAELRWQRCSRLLALTWRAQMQRMINENQLVTSDYHLSDLSSMFSPADDCIDTLALLVSNEYSVIKHYEVLLPHLKNEPEFCRDLQMVTRAM